MEKLNSKKLLTQFNNLYKEQDDVYHSLARHYGLSDSALWILYIIRETEGRYTQSQICEMLSMSRQTVNSALKTLETAGYISLEPLAGNQKSKQILLTASGNRFAMRTADNVLQMDQRAFEYFSEEEQLTLFRLFEAYVKRLKEEAQGILQQPFMEEPRIDDND